MARVNILALRCPECAAELDGLENDGAYFCLNCKMAYEAGEEGFRSRSYGVVMPRKPDADNLIWLPMWMFEVETKVNARPKELEMAQKVIDGFPRVWVSAFKMWRPSYFGDPGYLYTSHQIDWQNDDTVGATHAAPLPRLTGLSRGIKEAHKFVKPYLLSVLDRRIDVAFIEVSGDIKDTHLLAVPFSDRGDKIIDTQIDWEYPNVLVEELHMIRALKQAEL